MATNLYVSATGADSNDGSQNTPFRTILAASQHAQAGTVVHVGAGTYAGGFTTAASGTAAAHITYVSDTPGAAKIVGGGTAADAMGWWNKGDYVDIKGFEIDGSGSQATSWRFGFYGSGSHDTFQGNKVHDILTDATAFANAKASGNGGAGAEMDNYYGATDGSILGNVIYNIGPSGQSTSLVQAIYQTESGTVANNIVYNVAGAGVSLWHGAQHINIVNNTIDNARDGGIDVGSGDGGSSSTTGDYVAVANNTVTNSSWGILESGTTGVHNTYVDNLFYGDTSWNVKLQNGLTATGTVVADPKFVNTAGHDYHLQSSSPAINTGTASGAPATDFAGTARPQGGGYDIGAYEYGTANVALLSTYMASSFASTSTGNSGALTPDQPTSTVSQQAFLTQPHHGHH
jgi:hypothetical protein